MQTVGASRKGHTHPLGPCTLSVAASGRTHVLHGTRPDVVTTAPTPACKHTGTISADATHETKPVSAGSRPPRSYVPARGCQKSTVKGNLKLPHVRKIKRNRPNNSKINGAITVETENTEKRPIETRGSHCGAGEMRGRRCGGEAGRRGDAGTPLRRQSRASGRGAQGRERGALPPAAQEKQRGRT